MPPPGAARSFHRLTVSEVRRLTEDAIEVTFDVPGRARRLLRLPARPVRRPAHQMPDESGDVSEVRRSYSICAAPVSSTTAARNGWPSSATSADSSPPGQSRTWRAGSELDVMSPEGTFISKHVAASPTCSTGMNHAETGARAGTFVAIAAGSGITPVLAHREHAAGGSPDNRVLARLLERTSMDTMFVEELADLKDKYPARLALYHVLSRERRIAPLMSGTAGCGQAARPCWARPSTATTWTNGFSAAPSTWCSCAATCWPPSAWPRTRSASSSSRTGTSRPPAGRGRAPGAGGHLRGCATRSRFTPGRAQGRPCLARRTPAKPS